MVALGSIFAALALCLGAAGPTAFASGPSQQDTQVTDVDPTGVAEPKYIGGTPPTQNYPAGAFASLQYDAPKWDRYDWHTCGATLVFANVIVTSAHCVTDPPPAASLSKDSYAKMLARFFPMEKPSERIVIPTADKQFKVRVGSQNRTDGVMSAATVVWVDPEWDWAVGPKPVNDIAVLKLADSLDVQTVALASGPARPGTVGYALGWGLVNPDWSGEVPTQIQELRTKVVSPARCATADIASRDICVDNPNGTDGSCSGDSGGPFLIQEYGAWKLAGNTSRFYGPNFCGESPTVYTSSPEFRREIYAAASGVTQPKAVAGS